MNCEKNYIQFHQRPFIESILSESDLSECKIIKTPLDPSAKLKRCLQKKEMSTGLNTGCDELDGTEFRSIIRKLNYLASTTRLDLSYAVSYLSQFRECQHKEHMHAIRGVLRYLAGTANLGIRYERCGDSTRRIFLLLPKFIVNS